MANFEETLVEYKVKREELRSLQGEVSKKRNEISVLEKDVEQLVRKYGRCRDGLLDAQSRPIPLLQAEVASHPVLILERYNGKVSPRGSRVVELVAPPPPPPPSVEPEAPPLPAFLPPPSGDLEAPTLLPAPPAPEYIPAIDDAPK